MITRRVVIGGALAVAVIVAGVATSSALRDGGVSARALAPRQAAVAAVVAAEGAEHPKVQPRAVPAALTKPLDLRAAPVMVPLRLQIPSIGLDVVVLGVGITSKHVMDAPEGPSADPVWQQAFWYRGSAIPGARSTALIAGHIDDPLGRPGVFANINRLRAGALIVLHDTRSGLNVRFAVTSATSYPLSETTDPSVLARMYGSGPVAGKVPARSADGRSHLTLVTCAGTFDHGLGTHDHRLAVYAVRIP